MPRFSRTQVAFVFILMACSVLMGGCRQQGWKKLSKRQLREVMLDVAFTRALMEERGNLPDSTRQAIYDDLFARHGIKQVDYDSSMAWYARYKIENQVTIVQMVADSLKQLEKSLLDHEQAKNEKLSALSGYDVDSVNFFGSHIRIFTPGQELIRQFGKLTFSYELKPKTVLRFTVRIHGLPANYPYPLEMQLMGVCRDGQVLRQSAQITRNGLYEVSLELAQGQIVERLYATMQEQRYLSGFVSDSTGSTKKPSFVVLDSFAVVRYSPHEEPVKEGEASEQAKDSLAAPAEPAPAEPSAPAEPVTSDTTAMVVPPADSL